MIKNKRVLGWIPARGGSKGIKDKNICLLDGKPLISYTIKAAKKSKYIDMVMVSTDSEKIAEVAKVCGAYIPGLRPKELASDTAKTIDALLYSLQNLQKSGHQFDIVCLLQPTSPLRNEYDIDRALELFDVYNCEKNLVSVSRATKNPVLLRKIYGDGTMDKLMDVQSTVRRQDMVPYYEVNGAIYINLIDGIDSYTSFNDNELPFIMEANHSIDIDEPIDFIVAEYLIKQK